MNRETRRKQPTESPVVFSSVLLQKPRSSHYRTKLSDTMGQGHSTTKNSQQQSSKYAHPVDSGSSTTTAKVKKRGTRSSSTKSSAAASSGLSHGGGSSKRSGGSLKEGSKTMPPGIGDRRLPAVPAQQHSPSSGSSTHPHHPAARTSSLTQHHQHQPVTSHRGTDRKNNAPPNLPTRQFSLSKQTSTGTNASGSTSNKHSQIEKYFNLYRDKEVDIILAEGMERFCIDLSVDPTEFIVLVLAWKFEASQMCRFTREEFINGCKKMEAFDAKSLRNRFPQLLQDARSKFKDLYQFTFSFGLDHSTGQRSLPTDMAVQLWDLVFTQEKPQVLERWFRFLGESDMRGISRDTWNMFLDFCQNVAPDLSNYDESEAWPTLFDDFVECELASRGAS